MNHGRIWIMLGAICAALSVALGAVGAHALPRQWRDQQVSEAAIERRVDNLETGARYQMYHALALVAIGVLQESTQSRRGRWAAWLFVAGIVLFSGSLYGFAITGDTHWVRFTPPFGGVAFMLGWIVLAARP